MKLYAVAIQAKKTMFTRSTVSACASSLFAINEDEAIGKALRFAREHYPEVDGWFSHEASVVEIGEKKVRDWLEGKL